MPVGTWPRVEVTCGRCERVFTTAAQSANCPACKKKYTPNQLRQLRILAGVETESTVPTGNKESTEAVQPDEVTPPPSSPASPHPVQPKQGWRSWFGGRKKEPKTRTPPRPKRKGLSGPRRSASEDIGDVWEMLGEMASTTPFWMAGHVMTFQGELVGSVLDDAVKGTTVDKTVIQPAMVIKERYGDAWLVISLPFQMQSLALQYGKLVQAVQTGAAQPELQRRQHRIRMSEKQAKRTIRRSFPMLAKAKKRKDEEDAEVAAAAAEIYPQLGGMTDGEGHPVQPEDAMFEELMAPLREMMTSMMRGVPDNGQQPDRSAGEPVRAEAAD